MLSRPPLLAHLACALAALLAAIPAAALSVYEEAVQGDLSNDRNAPTAIDVSPGPNVVAGTVSGTIAEPDDDFFTFTLEPGETLSAVVLLLHAPSLSTSFLGIHTGPTYTNLGNSQALGWVFFDSDDIGTDLLPRMAASNGNFTAPLGPGTYSFWFDESTNVESYRVDFQVTVVPEPGAAGLVGLGLWGLAARRRGLLSTCPRSRA